MVKKLVPAQTRASKKKAIDHKILSRLEVLQKKGKPDLLKNLIEMFLSRAPDRLQKINDSLEMQNSGSLAAEVHLLRSSCLHLGALRLGNVCSAIESHKEKPSWPKVRSLCDVLQTELRDATAELTQMLKLRSSAHNRQR